MNMYDIDELVEKQEKREDLLEVIGKCGGGISGHLFVDV